MGAVTSQATPVAGCLVRPLGVDALRGRGHARPSPRAGLAASRASDAVATRSPPRPVVDFDRRDDLQPEYLAGARRRRRTPAAALRARVERLRRRRSSSASAGALLPAFQSTAELERGELVRLGGSPVDVPLFWQQWNLRSPLLDAVADEIAAEARTALAYPAG